MSRTNKFSAKNAAKFISGSLGRFVINFFSLIILARLITPSEYGVWATLFATFSVVQILIEFGQANILITQVEKFDRVFKSLIAYNVVASLLVYTAVAGIFIFGLNINDYSFTAIVCLMLCLPSALLSQLLFIKIQTMDRFIVVNIIPVLVLIGGNVVGISLAYLGYGVESLAAKLLVESIFSLAIAKWLTGSYLYDNLPKSFDIKILLSASMFYTGISDVLIKAGNHIDKLVVGLFLQAGALGFYSRCYNFALLGVSLSGYSLTQLGMQSGAGEDSPKLYDNSVFWGYLVFFSLASFYILNSKAELVFHVILGNQWTEYLQYSWILSFLPCLKFLENFIYMIFVSDGKSSYMPFCFFVAYSVSLMGSVFIFSINNDIYMAIYSFFLFSFIVYVFILSCYLFIVSNARRNFEKLLTTAFGVVGLICCMFFVDGGRGQSLYAVLMDVVVCCTMLVASISLSMLLLRKTG